ncbi:MAG: MFS transporter, partial [Alphaproteobacteria bacterium]|nr:MFS transporter [Alphaproteobacteria bacterium]
LTQACVIGAMIGMAMNDPSLDAGTTAIMAAALAFAGATQDIVIDAYRIESADDTYQGAMSAMYVAGYRIAMIIGGAGALEIAGFIDVIEGEGLAGYDYVAWMWAYLAMAGFMLVGVITTLCIKEPTIIPTVSDDPLLETIKLKVIEQNNIILKSAFWAFYRFVWPILDFIQRYKKLAILILLVITTYRISDIVMGVIANVFYTDLGFEKQEIGRISKGFGLAATIFGTFVGGLLIRHSGVIKILILGAVLSAATNLLFAWMAAINTSEISHLIAIIAADNLSAGIATAAFIAYLSSLVNKEFSATQYALYSSIMVLFPKFLGGFSGTVVDASSYEMFFIGTALIGIPVIVLIFLLEKLKKSGDY